MDGRGISFRWSFLVLAILTSACGCVPGQSKLVSVESKFDPHDEMPEKPEPRSINPFAAKPKREPKFELAFALYHERNALDMKDKPEEQHRELDTARQAYQEILNYDTKNIEAYRGLARVYLAQRDHERAVATIRKALEFYPTNGQLYADWSIVHSKQNDFANAVVKLNKARELDPENQDFMKLLAINLVCSGQVDRGVEMMSRARGQAGGHYYVALLLDRMNRTAEARTHAQRALQTNPDFQKARTFLAELDQRNQPAATPLPAAPSSPPGNVGLQFVSDVP